MFGSPHPRARAPLALILVLASPAFSAAAPAAPDRQNPAAPENGLELSPPETPGSVTVLSGAQIADSAGEDAESALSSVPNVNELGYSADSQPATSNSISMRGLGAGAREGGISRALVTVDGVPLNDPFFGYIQWSRVPLDDIERIQISRGGGSTLWGNYAEGGVVNFTTRTDMQNEAALDGGGGSYGTYGASASGAYRIDGDDILQAFVEANGTSGHRQVSLSRKVPFIGPTASNAANAHLKDTFTPAPGLTAHLSLFYHDDHQRFETPLDTSDQQNLTFSGDIEKRFANGGVLALTLFHGDSIFDFRNSIYSLDSPPLAPLIEKLNDIHHVRAQDTGGSLVWSRQSGGVLKTWLAGADWHTISGDDRMNNFFRPDNSSGFPATRNGGDQLFAAGFVQATMAPVENLELTAGGRIQYLRNSNGYIGSFGGQGEVAAREYTYFEPRVDLRYSLPAGFALRGAYYRSYRAPNLSDQYYTQASGLFVQLPNPFLKPERLDGEELGLDFARSGFHSQITLYRAAINNYIVVGRGSNRAYSLHGWFMTQNQNAAAMQAQGIEAEVDWDIGAGFSAGFDYTLANSILKRNPLDPITAGQQIMDVPRHTETAGLSYVSPQGARISVDAHHISKTSWFATVQNDSDNPNRSFAGSNIVVDVYGSYPVTPNVDLYAEAQNLLGRRYHAVGYSEPLSSVVLGAPLEIFGGLRLRLR